MQTNIAIDKLNKLVVLIMLGLGLLIHGYCLVDLYMEALIKMCSAISMITK